MSEDHWQTEAIAKAVVSARGVAAKLAKPIGAYSESDWIWIISTAILVWIKSRYDQAIEQNFDPEEYVSKIEPTQYETATIEAILPALADQAQIDWSRSLMSWSQDEMVHFIKLTKKLLVCAEAACDEAPNVLRKVSDKAADWEVLGGEEIPF
jgi:hypothetical protein